MRTALRILIALVGGTAFLLIGAQFAGAPLSPVELFPEPKEVTVIFVGDIMLDRYIRAKMEQFGEDHVLAGVAEFLRGADIVAGNLEGPITSNESFSLLSAIGEPGNMRFTFPTTSALLLARYGFDLVSLGNNHSLDYGREGAEETKNYLAEANVGVIGDPLREAPDIWMKEVEGIRIAFVAFNEFFGQDPQDAEEAVRVSKEVQSAQWTVVMAHWGEEYLEDAPERIKELGRRFIDAGADLVIGSHPHVVQPFEDYRGGRIYYSLGNFVFDQYWNGRVRCGQAVTARFTKDGITYQEQDIGMERDGSTVLGCSQ